MIGPAHKGRVFPPFSYAIERGKLHEFLLAIGDDAAVYQTEDPPLPPTFPTVLTFWGGLRLDGMLKEVGIEIWNVLHGEQEYEYLSPMHIDDTITGQVRISDIYQKAGMDFLEFTTDYKNQNGLPVLRERSLIIVRG